MGPEEYAGEGASQRPGVRIEPPAFFILPANLENVSRKNWLQFENGSILESACYVILD